jgi:hypothetical protein
MNNTKTFAVGGAVLFAFSLTTSALAERLGTYDLPHVHTELPTPEPLPSLSVPTISGANVAASTISFRFPAERNRVR